MPQPLNSNKKNSKNFAVFLFNQTVNKYPKTAEKQSKARLRKKVFRQSDIKKVRCLEKRPLFYYFLVHYNSSVFNALSA